MSQEQLKQPMGSPNAQESRSISLSWHLTRQEKKWKALGILIAGWLYLNDCIISFCVLTNRACRPPISPRPLVQKPLTDDCSSLFLHKTLSPGCTPHMVKCNLQIEFLLSRLDMLLHFSELHFPHLQSDDANTPKQGWVTYSIGHHVWSPQHFCW